MMIFILITVWVIGVVGWILNIVKIVKTLKTKEGNPAPISAMFVARCIGVVAAPLGAVLGFM